MFSVELDNVDFIMQLSLKDRPIYILMIIKAARKYENVNILEKICHQLRARRVLMPFH